MAREPRVLRMAMSFEKEPQQWLVNMNPYPNDVHQRVPYLRPISHVHIRPQDLSGNGVRCFCLHRDRGWSVYLQPARGITSGWWLTIPMSTSLTRRLILREPFITQTSWGNLCSNQGPTSRTQRVPLDLIIEDLENLLTNPLEPKKQSRNYGVLRTLWGRGWFLWPSQFKRQTQLHKALEWLLVQVLKARPPAFAAFLFPSPGVRQKSVLVSGRRPPRVRIEQSEGSRVR